MACFLSAECNALCHCSPVPSESEDRPVLLVIICNSDC